MDPVVGVEDEEDTRPGGGPDHLQDGLVVHSPGPCDQRSVIVSAVQPEHNQIYLYHFIVNL